MRSLAVIEIVGEEVQIGDTLWFKGHTTDFKHQVESMQEEQQTLTRAVKGQLVGIKVTERVREKDRVYKVVE